MYQNLEPRDRLLFAQDEKSFREAAEAIVREVGRIDDAPRNRLLADAILDLRSYLPRWRLDRVVDKKTQQDTMARFFTLLRESAPDDPVRHLEKETAELEKSPLITLSGRTAAGTMGVYWGYDQCEDLDYARRRGASFTTCNPGKVNRFMKTNPKDWDAIAGAVLQCGTKDKKRVFSDISSEIVLRMARAMRPIYTVTDQKVGFSAIQVDPCHWDNAEAMAEEVLRWGGFFSEKLGLDVPNIMFKLPATPTAVTAASIILSKRTLRLAATCNFSVTQHAAFYDVFDQKTPANLLVVVDYILKNHIVEDLKAKGIENAVSYAQQGVGAVYKKCYANLVKRRSNIMINGAGVRDELGVRYNYTHDVKYPVTFTMTKEIAQGYERDAKGFPDSMREPVQERDIDVLKNSATFRLAYEDGAPFFNDIRSFGPYRTMMEGFEKLYDECMIDIERRMT